MALSDNILSQLDLKLQELIKQRLEKIIEHELAESKKRIEENIRLEAARVGITVMKYFEIRTYEDSITIRIDTRDLKL